MERNQRTTVIPHLVLICKKLSKCTHILAGFCDAAQFHERPLYLRKSRKENQRISFCLEDV